MKGKVAIATSKNTHFYIMLNAHKLTKRHTTLSFIQKKMEKPLSRSHDNTSCPSISPLHTMPITDGSGITSFSGLIMSFTTL
jgi:hypothetical protein